MSARPLSHSFRAHSSIIMSKATFDLRKMFIFVEVLRCSERLAKINDENY